MSLSPDRRLRPFVVSAAPTNLAAAVAGSNVTLTWLPAAGGDPAVSYVVEAGSGSGLSDLANSDTGSAVPSLVATDVPAGTYFVRIRGRNASGIGAASNEIVVVVGGSACTLQPGPPIGLAASVSGSSLTLSWRPPASGCAPTAYIIDAGSLAGASNLASFSTGSTATSFSAAGVGAGTYFVRVRASNAGGSSAPSNEAQFTIGSGPCAAAPGPPAGLAATVVGTTVSLAWSAVSGATGYVLEAGSAPGLSNLVVSDVGATVSLSAAAGAGTYYVRVRARNACGSGAPSNEITVVIGSNPSGHVTTDRPDDIAGYQVKVMYVVPSDGADRQLDLNGALATSAEAWERWFQQESGGQRLRLDTFNGQTDIAFVRLGRSDAQIAASGVFVRDQVQAEINALGFSDPRKLYAVYYDGSSTVSCGGGAWPPALVGNVAAMYLRGAPPGAIPCAANPIGASVSAPGYIEFGMIHEIFHTIGLAATCAPHHVLSGHVSDSNNDLMWAGSAPWLLPAHLDIGRDDYYRHGTSCLDAAKSVFMTPTAADATPPPGWSRITAAESVTDDETAMCVLAPQPTEIRVRRP